MQVIAAISGILVLLGIISRRMWAQPIWYPDGWEHFLWFAAAYAILSAALVTFRPAAHRAAVGIFVLIVTAAAVGVLPVLAVAFFLASCFALGRLLRPAIAAPEAMLLGLACYMLLVQVLVHFTVNYPALYCALLAIPLAWNWRIFRSPAWPRPIDSRFEAGAQALAMFPLLCHWAVVLKPETGPDALSMHLANPMSIAFSFRILTWAVAPAIHLVFFTCQPDRWRADESRRDTALRSSSSRKGL